MSGILPHGSCIRAVTSALKCLWHAITGYGFCSCILGSEEEVCCRLTSCVAKTLDTVWQRKVEEIFGGLLNQV